MIKSMTGFGRSEYTDEEYRIIVEMKSVNHRYLDLGIKLPRIISKYEPEIRKTIREYAERGKVDVYITYEKLKSTGVTVRYDRDVAAEYIRYLNEMKQEFGLEEDIRPTRIARFPDVFTLEENYQADEKDYRELDRVLREAAERFAESREKEGENLKKDILVKLTEMTALVDRIEARVPVIITAYQEKLTEKVKALIENAAVDENRIVQETTIYADRVAVDEELVRLRSHIQAVDDILKEGGAAGRKLDFIVQEMNREANTTLSKSDDREVTDIGIDLKTLIEKIREQVQNIE